MIILSEIFELFYDFFFWQFLKRRATYSIA